MHGSMIASSTSGDSRPVRCRLLAPGRQCDWWAASDAAREALGPSYANSPAAKACAVIVGTVGRTLQICRCWQITASLEEPVCQRRRKNAPGAGRSVKASSHPVSAAAATVAAACVAADAAAMAAAAKKADAAMKALLVSHLTSSPMFSLSLILLLMLRLWQKRQQKRQMLQ